MSNGTQPLKDCLAPQSFSDHAYDGVKNREKVNELVLKNGIYKLEDYFVPHSLSDDVEALSDPALDAANDRGEANALVLNTVIKYLTNYSGVKTKNIDEIRSQVNRVIRLTKEADRNTRSYDATRYRATNGGQNETDYYPLMCVADLRATAAIFKEIAFNDRFKKEDHFIGIDLGSGTGILTLAMAIAAKRQGIKDIMCIGVEKNSVARRKSSHYLKKILGDDVEIIRGNIISPDLYDEIKGSEFLSRPEWNKWNTRKPIHYWLSETYATSTPPVKGDRYSGDSGAQKIIWRDWTTERQVNTDPFYDVYWNTRRAFKRFKRDVGAGRTAMFPDPINGLFNPNFERSTLKLMTGLHPNQPLLLEHIGWEFNAYEDFNNGCHRWEPTSTQLPLL